VDGPVLRHANRDQIINQSLLIMILNPEKMVAENEAAKALLAEYLSPMANQNLTEEEARSIHEYFRFLPK